MIRGAAPVTKLTKTEAGADQQGWRFATNFATQVLVAFIGAFLFGFYFVETFVAPGNTTAKTLVGAACSFATLLLETCLLVVHEQKKEMIEKRDRAQEERARKAEQRRAAARDASRAQAATDAGPGGSAPAGTEATSAAGDADGAA